jgi:hypothetical protein
MPCPSPGKMQRKRQRKELNLECLSPVNQGIPEVDNNTPLLPAMEKACNNEEQREEKIMYYALDLVPSLSGWIPGTDVMDIRHIKTQRVVFDNLTLSKSTFEDYFPVSFNIKSFCNMQKKIIIIDMYLHLTPLLRI